MRHHITSRLAGALGFALAATTLAGCSDDSGTPTAQPAEAASAEPASESDSEPDSACTEISYNRNDLPAGCWSIAAAGMADGPRLELDLGEGFSAGGAHVWRHPAGGGWEGVLVLTPAEDVYRDPCRRNWTTPTGSTVEEFTAALDAQAITDMTPPEPVSLGGYDGQYVELSVPESFRYTSCRGRDLSFWTSGPSADRETGQRQRYWVVQVGEHRLAIAVLLPADATPRMVRRFTDAVATARFSVG